MKHLIFALCLIASFAQAQVSQRYAARIYRVGDQVIIADSSGVNKDSYPYQSVFMSSTNSLVRVNISGLSKYYLPAKILNSSGVVYSNVSAALALSGILATVPLSAVSTNVTSFSAAKALITAGVGRSFRVANNEAFNCPTTSPCPTNSTYDGANWYHSPALMFN